MPMSRAQKEKELDFYKKRFEEDEIVVITEYRGLSVAQMQDLRAQLRAEGATYKVTKNNLAKMAVKGTRYEKLADMFTGPVGVATSQDPVAAAKVAQKFAKDNPNLVIIGGGMGETVLDADGVEQLAKLPSLDELRGTLVGLLQAPAQKLVGVTQAPAGQMARVINAYATKGE